MSTTESTTMSVRESAGRTAGLTHTARDIVLLLARIGLGILMIYHAKLEYDVAGQSVSGIGDMFAQSNVPLPYLTGPLNFYGELIGGAAMIAGLGVPLVGVAMAINMVGAWVFVHNTGLYAMDGNGPELVIALGLLSLVLAVTGSGRIGFDYPILRRIRRRRTASA